MLLRWCHRWKNFCFHQLLKLWLTTVSSTQLMLFVSRPWWGWRWFQDELKMVLFYDNEDGRNLYFYILSSLLVSHFIFLGNNFTLITWKNISKNLLDMISFKVQKFEKRSILQILNSNTRNKTFSNIR